MAAIGTAWVDGAWIFEGWAVGAWSTAATASVTGSATEPQLVTGGQTFTVTLTADTLLAAGTGPIGSIANTQALIDGLVSAQSETNGWNAERTNIAVTDIVRTSDTVATLTLPALTSYAITADEILTWTIPAEVLTAATELVGSPTITISNIAEVSGGGHFIPGFAGIRSGRRKALEIAEEVLDEIVAEVLDTPERPVQRVSRQMKSRIIDIATHRLISERVLIGEIDAIDRAAAKLAKFAVKRRLLKRSRRSDQKIEVVQPIVADTDQAIAELAFRLLNDRRPINKSDEEIILLMQILLML